MTETQPVIGLFDSGVGGLSVLQRLLNNYPKLDYVYLADSAYFPYSLQPAEFIEQRVLQLCQWMEKNYSLTALIMACNTASATTYADLVEYDLPFPVYEPIGTTCQWIQTHCQQAKNIVVLATPVTIATNAYLTNLSAQFDITQLPSAELVQAVEQGTLNHPESDEAKAVLAPLMQVILSHQPDVLVLGSTHFSWAKKAIQPYLPKNVHLVDSAECLATLVSKHIMTQDKTSCIESITDIITTAASPDFNEFVTTIPSICNQQVTIPETGACASTTA